MRGIHYLRVGDVSVESLSTDVFEPLIVCALAFGAFSRPTNELKSSHFIANSRKRRENSTSASRPSLKNVCSLL